MKHSSSQPVNDTQRARNDARAAPYAINRSLKTLNLQEWSWTVTDWLRLYDGFEQYIPASDDPMVAAARVFNHVTLTRAGAKIIVSDIIKVLAKQPFLYWHAQWVDAQGNPVGAEWRPLFRDGVPFWDYLDSKPEGAVELHTDRRADMHVEHQVLVNWLVAGYFRFVMPRRSFEPQENTSAT